VVDGDVQPLAEHLELLHGGGAVDVRRDEQRLAALLDEHARELAGGGRLAGALQTDHHDLGHARAELQRGVDRAHEALQLLVGRR